MYNITCDTNNNDNDSLSWRWRLHCFEIVFSSTPSWKAQITNESLQRVAFSAWKPTEITSKGLFSSYLLFDHQFWGQ